MKKTMILAAVAAIAAGHAFADRTVEELKAGANVALTNNTYEAYCRSVTTNEWRTLAEYAIAVASTNAVAASTCLYRPDMLRFAPECIYEYDQAFADAGIGIAPPWNYTKFPKAVEAYIAAPTNAQYVSRIQASIALMRKHGNAYWWHYEAPEMANFAMEVRLTDPSINRVVDKTLELVQKEIKRRMRMQGMSITVKDGVNPVQLEVDRLTAAFNAPRYAGVKEWFAKYYPEYTWVDSVQMTDEQVNKMKDDVFYGDRPFRNKEQAALRFYLGVEEYNKFVKAFNK